MNYGKFTIARRTTVIFLIGLFTLQLFRVKVLFGGLTGSLIFKWLNLLDLFAFLETTIASRSFTLSVFYATIPILIIYFILGRAFCGWICPLDLIFSLIKLINQRRKYFSLPQKIRGAENIQINYLIFTGFLILSFFGHVPYFTSFLSPLINFFRSLQLGFYWAMGFPVEIALLWAAIFLLGGVLISEFFWPRLWCQNICPVGRIYGFFNHLSLLHLEFTAEECANCLQCEQACYMGVKITSFLRQKKIRDSACILCGQCVEACRGLEKNLKLRFGL